MLSYQHGFHAGNRADVLKHAVLHGLLKDAVRTAGTVLYVETHSGRGDYDLSSPEALKTGEFKHGIEAALALSPRPAPLKPWLDLVENWSGPQSYPGSPRIASLCLRAVDRAILYEAHAAEHMALSQALGDDDRFRIEKADGYTTSLRIAPRRGETLVALVDPSYETGRDIEQVAEWVPRAIRRWFNPRLAVWLPLFRDGREQELIEHLTSIPESAIVSAQWSKASSRASSLIGSAMFLTGWNAASISHARSIGASVQQSWN